MDLKTLVATAIEKSPKFKEKYEWRVKTRNKAPDLKWLMPLLEEALGADFVVEAAKAHIAEQEALNGKEKDLEGPSSPEA